MKHSFILGALVMVALGQSNLADGATVLYNDRVVKVENTLDDPNDLWVTPADLTRINGFVLKPEGACLDDICIPLLDDSGMLVERDGAQWFNVTALAGKLQQAVSVDHEKDVWSFGQIPATRSSFLQGAEAPDFELEDRHGKTIRLSDYRGKKVLLVTWASW